jgi:serine/threonine protein kinase
MTADNLFETIYSEGFGGKLGMPIGIRLIRNEQVISELYHANTTTLLQLRNILEKKLNQRGFKEQFRPLRKIGKGNFGSVYMAERIEDGRRVAVKAFCKSASYSQEKGRDSLINEIMMLRRLSHRNICELVSVYES